MGTLSGKVALVTGGGKGIGKGIALSLIRAGAKVAIGCNASRGMAEETLVQLQQLGDACLIQSDIRTEEGCAALVDGTVRAFGKLDILVNNAAMQTQYTLLESTRENLDDILKINLRAAWLMMIKALPYLKESEHGRIILISSVHGRRPTDFDVAYSVSKGGLKMLMREAAIEFAPYGITVNAIAPAAVSIEGKTGNPRSSLYRNVERPRPYDRYPLGRIGLPRDIGEMAAFMAGDETDFLSGTTIRMDGCSMLM